MSKDKQYELKLLFLFPLLAYIISLAFQANLFITIFLFFGPPAFYLSLKNPQSIRRCFLFAFITSTTIGILFDYLGFISGSWYTIQTFFPFRFFGLIPIENIIWSFLYIYTILIFYEHYFSFGKILVINTHMKYFVLGISILFFIYFSIFFVNKALFYKIPYMYFFSGLIFFGIPITFFLSKYPRYRIKFLITASYFIILGFLNELAAILLKHWTFPGKTYVGWIELMTSSPPQVAGFPKLS